MNELIKVESHLIGGQAGIRTVNARELHGFLGSKQEFSNWIKARIERYGFLADSDFTIDKVINGRVTRIDYHISLDMAKELAMVEHNAKGREARRYFIECERKLMKSSTPAISQSLPEALRLAADLAERNAQQAQLLEQQKPAVEFVKQYAEAESMPK
jgi:phage anti-repressor protein